MLLNRFILLILVIHVFVHVCVCWYGNEAPSTVLIFKKDQEYYAYPLPHCSGTILSEDTVITAANCFGTGTVHAKDFFLVAGDLQSYLYSQPNTTDSSYSYKSKNSPQKKDIEKIIIHPYYNNRPEKVDLAIVKLSTKLETNSDVEIAQLPPPGVKHEGNSVKFAYLVVAENVEIPERPLPFVKIESVTLSGHTGCLDYYEMPSKTFDVRQYLPGAGAIVIGVSAPAIYGMFVSGSTWCKIEHALPWIFRETGVSPAYEIFLDEKFFDDFLKNTQEEPAVATPGTGDKYLYLSPTQILHLPSFEQLPCKQHFPDEVKDAYAAVVPYDGVDHLMICKGSHYWSGCLVLTESGWKTSTNNFHRSKGVSSTLGDGGWLITGGYSHGTRRDGTGTTPSIVYYDGEWTESVSLPDDFRGYCQVSVGNETFFIGGMMTSSGGMTSYVWVHHKDIVTELPHNLTTPRTDHACVEFGGLIYVMGGVQYNVETRTHHMLNSVEVYNPATPDLGWLVGPPLPKELLGAHAVVHEDNLYVVGGRTDMIDIYSLYLIDKFNTAVFKLAMDDDEWKILPGVTIQPWCGTCAAKSYSEQNPKEQPLDHNAPVVDGNFLHCF